MERSKSKGAGNLGSKSKRSRVEIKGGEQLRWSEKTSLATDGVSI